MIALNINKIRKEKGLSIRKLAKDCKLSRTTLDDIEKGRVKNPGIMQICKICKGIGKSPNDIIPEELWRE